MVSVRIAPEPARYDEVVTELWEAGTAGLIERDGEIEAFFDDAAAAGRFGVPRDCGDSDWVHTVQDAWPPVTVGERFFIAAPWRTEPTPPGRIRLEINPGQLFGTGGHRSTQLCLEALERAVRPGDSVLDVGSGSGILSRAAKLLGAGRVVACDIDSDGSKAEALSGLPFFVGSADAVRSDMFDILVANISETAIEELRPELHRIAPKRILSGFQNANGEWACIEE